jgi:hypothetical protein
MHTTASPAERATDMRYPGACPSDSRDLEARPVRSVADLLCGEVVSAAVRGADHALFVRRVWVS